MGFQVVQGTPYITWVPVDNGETLRVGQLVTMAGNLSGAINLGAAAGLSGNNSIGKVPWGLVIGTNEKVPLYDSSYKAEYTTQVTPHAQTRELWGGAPWVPMGDQNQWVQVAVLDPTVVLKGQICNATLGVAPLVGTVTTGNTAGTGFTTGTAHIDAQPLAGQATLYCRSGANKGIYRTANNASTTVATCITPFPYDIAIGDTFTGVCLKLVGPCFAQTDAEASFFTCASNGTTDSWMIDVLRLDLSVAGEEHVIFKFPATQLCPGVIKGAIF